MRQLRHRAWRRVRTCWELHPSVDIAPALVALAAWIVLPLPPLLYELEPGIVSSFLTVVASFAGVGLTVTTFAATLTYTSTGRAVVLLRNHHGPQLRRNWISVLGGLLSCAALATGALLLAPSHPQGAACFGIMLLIVSSLRMFRGIIWLRLILWSDEISPRLPTNHA